MGELKKQKAEVLKKQLNDKELEECNYFRPITNNKRSQIKNDNQLDYVDKSGQRRLNRKKTPQAAEQEDENVGEDEDEFNDIPEIDR